jgi:hypothetical protein
MEIDFFINSLGLLLNIIGTLLIAFAFGKNLEDANQTDKKGSKILLASFLHPCWFKWGIGILLNGFFLQLLSQFF